MLHRHASQRARSRVSDHCVCLRVLLSQSRSRSLNLPMCTAGPQSPASCRVKEGGLRQRGGRIQKDIRWDCAIGARDSPAQCSALRVSSCRRWVRVRSRQPNNLRHVSAFVDPSPIQELQDSPVRGEMQGPTVTVFSTSNANCSPTTCNTKNCALRYLLMYVCETEYIVHAHDNPYNDLIPTLLLHCRLIIANVVRMNPLEKNFKQLQPSLWGFVPSRAFVFLASDLLTQPCTYEERVRITCLFRGLGQSF